MTIDLLAAQTNEVPRVPVFPLYSATPTLDQTRLKTRFHGLAGQPGTKVPAHLFALHPLEPVTMLSMSDHEHWPLADVLTLDGTLLTQVGRLCSNALEVLPMLPAVLASADPQLGIHDFPIQQSAPTG